MQSSGIKTAGYVLPVGGIVRLYALARRVMLSRRITTSFLCSTSLCALSNTISATFAIGSSLAAAAGVLMGVYFNTINPLMGIMPGLKAFVAAVLGGIGIIPGAMLGGIAMGLIESIVSGLGFSTWRDAVAFLILIVVLIVKPSGLLGKNIREKV